MRYLLSTAVLLAGSLCTTPLIHAQSPDNLAFLNLEGRLGGGSYIGVGLTDIDAERAAALKLDGERGVEVARVQEGSPADKAGLRTGDVLLSYNGENILGAQQLGRLVSETPQGRHVKMQYWRDGKMQTTTVTTGSPPQMTGFNVRPDQPNLELQLQNMRNQAARFFSMMDVPAPLIAWKNRALGVECEPMNPQLADYFGVKQGVLIRFVDQGSLADKAGFKCGDVVVSVGDRSLGNPRDFSQCLHDQSATGKPIQVAVVRNHKHLSLNLAGLPHEPE